MRWLLIVFLFLAAASCYSRRYFRVPPTEEAHWCVNYCANDFVRCSNDARPTAKNLCQKYSDDCVASCPGAFEVPKDTGMADVVDDEEKLRVVAARELGCTADLTISPLDTSDVPNGWAATVSGCGKKEVFKIFDRSGWVLQAPTTPP